MGMLKVFMMVLCGWVDVGLELQDEVMYFL